MDTSRLKRFAPECRTKLMKQVEVKLDYVLTAKTPDLAAQEKLLSDLRRVLEHEGRAALIERVAYTWFNRFAAFRYLDAHGWHPFRVRVITAPSEGDVLPELLQQVRKGVVPEELKEFVSASRINDLLDGNLPSPNPQAEVQRLLVIGVSQYYADLLPNLFDKIDAFTELLLPDDLLTEHSVVHGFVSEITDEDCAEVEILGWLYQFYISEKKDEVMARKKAVPSEDIPAVTQLFTPHWIVRYLVENSLGRLWLRSRPDSRLREHMPYYVEEPEGQEPADSLTIETPEEIRLLDPACGSGHMLTYAFDLLVKIYEEEGYTPSEIPALILENNLHGLEICPRAAQLAQFALVCKAREQSRSAFRRAVQPEVMRLQDVVISPEEIHAWSKASGEEFSQDELAQIHQFREHTETFGSLIQPVLDVGELDALMTKIGDKSATGDLLVQDTQRRFRLVVNQAEMLSQRYQVVVANPPYMGRKQMNNLAKNFADQYYPDSAADFFAMFLEKGATSGRAKGFMAMVTLESWMFLPTFEELRVSLYSKSTIESMLHMPYLGKGGTSMGISFGTAATIFSLSHNENYKGRFMCVRYFETDGRGVPHEFPVENERLKTASVENFRRIPGSPVAYWASRKMQAHFEHLPSLSEFCRPRQGMATADNDRFLRHWHEVSDRLSSYDCDDAEAANSSQRKWFPYNKGGPVRNWYGNCYYVVNWENDGYEIRNFLDDRGKVRSAVRNPSFYFRPGITWTTTTTARLSARETPKGFLFDVKGSSMFPETSRELVLGFLVSPLVSTMMDFLNPTSEFQVGNMATLPFEAELPGNSKKDIVKTVRGAIEVARADWDNFETSWDFRDLPLLRTGDWEVEPGQPSGAWKGRTLAESWANYAAYCTAAIRRMQELETENNRLWIDVYGLQDELTPEVPEDEITLARADARDDMAAFVSYAVGCMMGRYSLDKSGLILADAGDTVEDYLEKVGKSADELTFAPDDDAIVPITEDEWFPDDAASRVRDFLRATFGPETLEQNLTFLEDSLGKPLRKYFTANTGGFYADHVKTYKKRPIYWLFQSPKKHFRALVYLHRYTKDTVNILLTGYLREFRHKLVHQESELQAKVEAETATAADRKKLKKTREAILDVEQYERDTLLPLAQQRLEIDLDDGVKANYPKFGKALAKVTGLS